jgi:hypothetical protein
MKNPPALEEFKKHLIAAGKSKHTVEHYVSLVRQFLKHSGNQRLDRLSEDLTRSFFAGTKGKDRRSQASVISQFLKFSLSRLPVPVNARGAESPRAPAPAKQIALRQKWNLEKLLDQKTADDELIAKLARKVIDGYLICQREIKGEQNLDDLVRYVDECRELIETNLTLFMSLSAQGHNVHSKIDERVIR